MHQLDLCEGLMMSIAAEQRQKQQNSEPGELEHVAAFDRW